MTCCHRCATAQRFDATVAGRDLRRFRKRGPDASTRQLLVGVQAASLPAEGSVLDIGGGIGAQRPDRWLAVGFERRHPPSLRPARP